MQFFFYTVAQTKPPKTSGRKKKKRKRKENLNKRRNTFLPARRSSFKVSPFRNLIFDLILKPWSSFTLNLHLQPLFTTRSCHGFGNQLSLSLSHQHLRRVSVLLKIGSEKTQVSEESPRGSEIRERVRVRSRSREACFRLYRGVQGQRSLPRRHQIPQDLVHPCNSVLLFYGLLICVS